MHNLNEIFNKVGKEIDSQWSKYEYKLNKFSDIAAENLIKINKLQVPYKDILDLYFNKSFNVTQGHNNFSQYQITLYNNDFFYIEALFWSSGTTTIHEHNFTGAFLVLEGSSLQAEYTYEVKNKISESMSFGNLALQDKKILEKKSIQKINLKSNFIHSIFHLENPSVTIVIKSKSKGIKLHQFNYNPCGLAISPFYNNLNINKFIKLYAITHSINPKLANDYLLEFIKNNEDNFEMYIRFLLAINFNISNSKLELIYDKLTKNGFSIFKLKEYVTKIHQLNSKRSQISEKDDLIKLGEEAVKIYLKK